MVKYCSECGNENDDESKYCNVCGTALDSLDKSEIIENETFFNHNKIPITIISVTAIIVILMLIIFPSAMSSDAIFELESGDTQSVQVGNVYFDIPVEYVSDPRGIDYKYENSVLSYSQLWKFNTESIGIMVFDGGPFSDASSAIDANGGVLKTMYGYEGYYAEEEGLYSFAFEKDNKLVAISVSSPYIFDEITVR